MGSRNKRHRRNGEPAHDRMHSSCRNTCLLGIERRKTSWSAEGLLLPSRRSERAPPLLLSVTRAGEQPQEWLSSVSSEYEINSIHTQPNSCWCKVSYGRLVRVAVKCFVCCFPVLTTFVYVTGEDFRCTRRAVPARRGNFESHQRHVSEEGAAHTWKLFRRSSKYEASSQTNVRPRDG